MVVVSVLSGCSISREARRDKYLALGKTFVAKKDYVRAILEFRNAAQAMPKDAEPYYQIGLAALDSGDIRTCVLSLRKAIQLNPKHAAAQLKLTELMAMGDQNLAREAESRLRGLMETTPITPEMLNTLAFTELRLGKTADAVQTLEDLLSKNPGELTSAILLARARLAAKDMQGAEKILQKASAAAPNAARPHVVLGEFYRDTNRPSDAEKQLRMALNLEPDNAEALYSLAGILYGLGRMPEAEATFRHLETIDHSPYPFIYALFLLRQGRHDEAIRDFERLAKLHPNDRASRTRLVAAYELVGRTDDAAKVLEQALKKDHRDLDALVQHAELSIGSHKYDDAERDLNSVLQLEPDSAPMHYLLGKVHQARGQALSYRQELSRAVELDPFLLNARLELAQSFIAGHDPKGALDLLDATPTLQKTMPAVIAQRNWALWAGGDMDQMRKGIDAGLAKGRSTDLLLQDALWKLRTGGSPAAARALLVEALKIDPTDIRALSALQQSYELQKQTAQAVGIVKEYAARVPQSAPVQDFLGSLLLSRGDRAGARAAFQAAKADAPHSVQADLALVQVDVADGKLDDAQRRLQGVLSADPGNTTAHLWLSNIEIAKGDHRKASEQLRAVLVTEPDNPQALNNLAYLLAENGNRNQLTEALKYAQRAKELAPDTPAYSDTLGWVLYQQGLYASAIREFESATARRPDAVSKYHLAMAYAKAGDGSRARAELEAALKQNATIPEASQAKQVLGAAPPAAGNAR